MDMTCCLTGKINLGMDPVLPEIQSVTRAPLTIDDDVNMTEAQLVNRAGKLSELPFIYIKN